MNIHYTIPGFFVSHSVLWLQTYRWSRFDWQTTTNFLHGLTDSKKMILFLVAESHSGIPTFTHVFYALIGFELQKCICVLCFLIYYIVFANSPLIFKLFKFLSVPWFFYLQ